jgi:hypothetical protein
MQLARYEVVENGKSWAVSHDGQAEGEYATKEAAFEAAVAAASLAIKQGHEVSISVPSTAGN